jgi:opacity protein-like surface antigen
MRPFLLLAALAALVGAAVAAADATDPKTKITQADQVHATASLLKFSDLGPAWSGAGETPVSLKIPVCPGDQANNSDLTLTGHAESYLELKSEGLQIDTDVEIFKSAGEVNTLFKRMVTPLLSACLKYDLLKSLGTAGATIGNVTLLKLQKAGAHSSDYRVSLKYSGHPVVSDYIFVSQGRTQFFVNVVAPGPLTSQLLALEDRIAATLAARAVKT